MRNKSLITVAVFTDSYATIIMILEPKVRHIRGAVRDLTYQNAINIKNNGPTLILRWVSSYSKILGNEKGDAIAKNVAHKRDRRTDH